MVNTAKPPSLTEACKKYRKELKEIEDAAKAANCDTNFLYRSTIDRYLILIELLAKAEEDMKRNGLTIKKVTPKGAEMEIANPAIQIYNQTASAANSTVSTLLRVIQQFKFMVANAGEDDDL